MNFDALDPGIREVVRRLHAYGFKTTDSGDGVSKPADWYASGEALNFPHVVVRVTADAMLQRAHELTNVLGANWIVEASYDTRSRVALLIARTQDSSPQARQGCINCGEKNDGGYETEEVGPFCSQCWEFMKEHFTEARQGWQPIETAPKDGTTILVAGRDWIAPSSGYRDGRWWTWHPPLLGERPQRSTAAEDPTYWMSIPPVPAQEPSE